MASSQRYERKVFIMANFNFTKVIIGGRLTAEPELKQTQSGVAVVSFSVAVNRRTKPGEEQKTDFFNVTAWRATAEFVARYFHKGSSICVVGTIQNNDWTDQQNVKHYKTDIVADEVTFVDSKNDSQSAEPSGSDGFIPPEYSAPVEPKFEEINTDDDLPF